MSNKTALAPSGYLKLSEAQLANCFRWGGESKQTKGGLVSWLCLGSTMAPSLRSNIN